MTSIDQYDPNDERKRATLTNQHKTFLFKETFILLLFVVQLTKYLTILTGTRCVEKMITTAVLNL